MLVCFDEFVKFLLFIRHFWLQGQHDGTNTDVNCDIKTVCL